jgi:ribosomal protein S18 acetylase RimI-like enzyme
VEASQLCGFVAFSITHSLVEPEPEKSVQCQVKELYVRRLYRGRGAGRALMTWVSNYALSQGASRMDWLVNASNDRGIAFYKSIGATQIPDRLSFRLSRGGIEALASSLGTNNAA